MDCRQFATQQSMPPKRVKGMACLDPDPTPMAVIGVFVVWLLPETIRLSFTDTDLGGKNWVGLASYQKQLSSAKVNEVFGRTFTWMCVSLKMISGLIGATLLNAAIPSRAVFCMIIAPPWVIPRSPSAASAACGFTMATRPGDATIAEGQSVDLSINSADCHKFDASGAVLRRPLVPTLQA